MENGDDTPPNLDVLDGATVIEGTRVDLGDDLLLEKTVALHREQSAPRKAVTPVEELLSSAKILLSEGLIDDAKKALRRVLILDRKNAFAQQMLREIQDNEQKRLLALDDADPSRRPRRTRAENTPDGALSALEKELQLDTQEETAQLTVGSLEGATGEDRVDLGIGLLEMGFHEEAAAQFQAAAHSFALRDTFEAALAERAAQALLAQTYLEAGRPLDTIIALQPWIKNSEISPADKIEFLYLMARAHAALGKADLALYWFERVRELDPKYRDVEERLRARSTNR